MRESTRGRCWTHQNREPSAVTARDKLGVGREPRRQRAGRILFFIEIRIVERQGVGEHVHAQPGFELLADDGEALDLYEGDHKHSGCGEQEPTVNLFGLARWTARANRESITTLPLHHRSALVLQLLEAQLGLRIEWHGGAPGDWARVGDWADGFVAQHQEAGRRRVELSAHEQRAVAWPVAPVDFGA